MDSSGEPLAADEVTCTSASEGLEEGEVEGETLLIVESEDQGSVDLSHDQSGDSLTSDLGEEGEGGWACEDMSFYCERCHKWTPAGEPITTGGVAKSCSLSLAACSVAMAMGALTGVCCSSAPRRTAQLPERRQLLQVHLLQLLRGRQGEL